MVSVLILLAVIVTAAAEFEGFTGASMAALKTVGS